MNAYRPPTYVRRFCDVLSAVALDHLELSIARPPVKGYGGILTSTRIQYNVEPWNFLGRDHEYTFLVKEARVELSLQLYLNETDYWRLFCYCSDGMLLSLNLTLLREAAQAFDLSQTLRLTTRGQTEVERSRRTAMLCSTLTHMGLVVDDTRRLILGTFDAKAGRFLDTTPKSFIRDFALAALVKGHFMGNKGYRLPGLPHVSTTWTTETRSSVVSRSVPPGVRYLVLERARGRCKACGNGIRDGVRLDVDHIVPYSQGGKTESRNLQALCQRCNIGKGNRSQRRL